MNPCEHGKPGEVWRAREEARTADWLILDGELQETAQELGYERPAVLIATRYEGERRSHEYKPSELTALTSLDAGARDGLREGSWEQVYPEHEKLKAISDRSQTIGEFLEFSKYTLCELAPSGYANMLDEEREEFVPVGNIQKVLAEYFDIDQDKLEVEKRQMLDKLRAMNAS